MEQTPSAYSDVAPVRPGEELDWAALGAWMRAALPGLEGDVSALQFPRGSANLTYRVQVGDARFVVRRPPFGSRAAGSHDMAREHRVLSRLWTVYPRAPRAFAYCSDPDVIGAEFVVSEYRPGLVVWDHVPAGLSTEPGAEGRVGLACVDALADLHAQDPASCGLGGLGRPDGYLGRQVAGWQRRWTAVEDQSVLPDAAEARAMVRELGRRLESSMPRSQRAGFVHNDFKIDNCQFAPGDPDRVVSVFDWDMATVGDVLVDLGTLLNYWPEHDLPEGAAAGFIAASATRALRLPSRVEVVERYARTSTLDLADIAWYESFGCWKTAVILQQLYARAVRGESADPRMRQRGEMVAPLARRALELVGSPT